MLFSGKYLLEMQWRSSNEALAVIFSGCILISPFLTCIMHRKHGYKINSRAASCAKYGIFPVKITNRDGSGTENEEETNISCFSHKNPKPGAKKNLPCAGEPRAQTSSAAEGDGQRPAGDEDSRVQRLHRLAVRGHDPIFPDQLQ